MTPPRRQRLILCLICLTALGGAVALGLFALQQNINLFFTPSQVHAGEIPPQSQHRPFRIGGLVVQGSVTRNPTDLRITFALTDTANTIPVSYTGILPDLFREGQGIVALGKMQNGQFIASQILAKHDENYMSPEVKAALDLAERAKKTQPPAH